MTNKALTEKKIEDEIQRILNLNLFKTAGVIGRKIM